MFIFDEGWVPTTLTADWNLLVAEGLYITPHIYLSLPSGQEESSKGDSNLRPTLGSQGILTITHAHAHTCKSCAFCLALPSQI